MRHVWLWCAFAAGVACSVDNPDYLGESDDSAGDDDSADTTGDGDGDGDGDGGDGDGGDGDGGDGDGDGVEACGDSIVFPGEFCFGQVVVDADDATRRIAFGRIDSGNLVDLVAVGSGVANLYRGDGGGGFPMRTPVATVSGNTRGVTAADLNDDGLDDVVIALGEDHELVIAMSVGDGSFLAPTILDLAGEAPYDVAVATIDVNATPDLVTANKSGDAIGVLGGVGDGTFNPMVTYGIDSDPVRLAVGDFDGSGGPDVVTAHSTSDGVSIALNTGAGGLGTPDFIATGDKAVGVAVALLDGDASPDLVVVHETGETMLVLLNDGSGGFTEAAAAEDLGSKPFDVAAADFDSDGAVDVVLAMGDTDQVLFRPGNGDGTFGPAEDLTTLSLVSAPVGFALADVNGDGVPDLGVAGDHGVIVLVSNP